MTIIKAEPQEMWSSEDKQNPGAVCKAFFIGGVFKVVVTKGEKSLEEEFRAEYEPRWGIDTADFQTIMAVAEKLSDQLKKTEEKEPI